VAAVGTSGTAEARWGGGWGWRGGWGPGPFIAGALVGGAIAGAYAYGPYGYYGYGGYPYGPCAWRTVWNGYRWVRACY
jgi:hypothetical protein